MWDITIFYSHALDIFKRFTDWLHTKTKLMIPRSFWDDICWCSPPHLPGVMRCRPLPGLEPRLDTWPWHQLETAWTLDNRGDPGDCGDRAASSSKVPSSHEKYLHILSVLSLHWTQLPSEPFKFVERYTYLSLMWLSYRYKSIDTYYSFSPWLVFWPRNKLWTKLDKKINSFYKHNWIFEDDTFGLPCVSQSNNL